RRRPAERPRGTDGGARGARAEPRRGAERADPHRERPPRGALLRDPARRFLRRAARGRAEARRAAPELQRPPPGGAGGARADPGAARADAADQRQRGPAPRAAPACRSRHRGQPLRALREGVPQEQGRRPRADARAAPRRGREQRARGARGGAAAPAREEAHRAGADEGRHRRGRAGAPGADAARRRALAAPGAGALLLHRDRRARRSRARGRRRAREGARARGVRGRAAPRRGARRMRPFRRMAGALVEVAAGSRLLDLLERSGGGDAPGLPGLTYHPVIQPRDAPLYPGVLSATPSGFTDQMRAIAARFQVIPLSEVVTALRERGPLPPRALLLTFDDAYRDFAEHAWPVLRSLGLPAVLFVATSFPDHPERAFWWDRLYRAV